MGLSHRGRPGKDYPVYREFTRVNHGGDEAVGHDDDTAASDRGAGRLGRKQDTLQLSRLLSRPVAAVGGREIFVTTEQVSSLPGLTAPRSPRRRAAGQL